MVAFITALIFTLLTTVSAYNIFLKETCYTPADCERFKGDVDKMCPNPACTQLNKGTYESCKGATSNGRQYVYQVFYQRPRTNSMQNRNHVKWSETAFNEADCRSCTDKNWNNYYECSKSVNWNHRNAEGMMEESSEDVTMGGGDDDMMMSSSSGDMNM
ncbi:hypothetical protein BC829DRAFT_397094 [Chytridium lagenaria]|nr:hypothetical protein BC829DRAFT_397094 [Chytridium lagenaria]